MTLLASQPRMPTGQWEVGAVVIEGDILPIGGTVAGAAVGAEFAGMFIVIAMAGVTICRRTFVDIVEVTLIAFGFGVFAFEFEIR